MTMNRPHCGNRKVRARSIFLVLIGIAITLGGCATTGNTPGQPVASQVDPYEDFNRKMFLFNDGVDGYVAAPLANAYKWITPQFMQTGVSNFFTNLKNVNVVINDVLQAKFAQGAEDTGRLAINTTLGLGGLVDVAKHVGLEQNQEDFEQTLAVWGVPRGPYLVLPLFGPSTGRGIPGAIFDSAANPINYITVPVQLLGVLSERANAEGALRFINEAALDPYVFTRESFLQWRDNLATDGKSEAAFDAEGFDDGLDGDADEASVSEGPAKPVFSLTLDRPSDAYSFSSVAQSFDDTAKSFEQAGSKVEQLHTLKRRR
ncbi:MAG: VacJ family lipoprotein [Methylobacter sp.]|nr:VacJ family lipoprotein [Methylobacter sp.]